MWFVADKLACEPAHGVLKAYTRDELDLLVAHGSSHRVSRRACIKVAGKIRARGKLEQLTEKGKRVDQGNVFTKDDEVKFAPSADTFLNVILGWHHDNTVVLAPVLFANGALTVKAHLKLVDSGNQDKGPGEILQRSDFLLEKMIGVTQRQISFHVIGKKERRRNSTLRPDDEISLFELYGIAIHMGFHVLNVVLLKGFDRFASCA